MPRILQSSFGSGEVSPSVLAKIDNPVYLSGCRHLMNSILTRAGAASRRYGSRYVGRTIGDYPARLFPFRLSSGAHYFVELNSGDGDDEETQYLTVHNGIFGRIDFADGAAHSPFPTVTNVTAVTPDAGLGITAANAYLHPYSALTLSGTRAFQYEDCLIFLNEVAPPAILRANKYGTPSNWRWGLLAQSGSPAVGSAPPLPAELLHSNDGIGEVITSDVPFFTPANVGHLFRVGGRSTSVTPTLYRFGVWFYITSFESTTKVRVNIVNPAGHQGSVGDGTDWCGPFASDGISRTLTWSGTMSTDPNNPTAVTITGATIENDVSGGMVRVPGSPDRYLMIVSGTGSTLQCVNYSATAIASPQTGNIHRVTSHAGVTRPYVFFGFETAGVSYPINGGRLLEICTDHAELRVIPDNHEIDFDVVGGTTVGGDILAGGGSVAVIGIATEDDDFVSYDVQLRTAPSYCGPFMKYGFGWSIGTGFPVAGCSHQGRAWLGMRDRIFACRSGEVDDWLVGDSGGGDDDPIELDLNDSVGGRISWMESYQDLLFGTSMAEYRISGSPITPSNLSVDRQSTHGSATDYGGNQMSALIGDSFAFVGKNRDSLRLARFNFDYDRYSSVDLTELAEHLFEGYRIMDYAVAFNPQPLVFVRLMSDDGTEEILRVLTLRRENGVVGWSRLEMGGGDGVESIVSISTLGFEDPNSGLSLEMSDGIFAVVPRTVSGGDRREIVMFAPGFLLDFQLTTDTGITAGAAGTAFSHLNGLTVPTIIQKADGEWVYIGDFPVTNGIVNYSAASLVDAPERVACGLGYTFRMVPVLPDFVGRGGPEVGLRRKIVDAVVLARISKALKVDGYYLGRQQIPGTPAFATIPFLDDDWHLAEFVGVHGTLPNLEITTAVPYYVEVAGINAEVSVE